MRFKLLAGKHQSGSRQRDQKTRKVLKDTRQDYAAYRNGKPQRHPVTGEELPDEIETDIDLAARFGAEKFERLDKPITSTAKG